MEATRAIGSGRVGTMRPVPVQEQAYQSNNAIDYQQYQQQREQQQQPAIIPVSSNIVNGVPFKLPSIQERLTKNRIFFDDKLKNNTNN